MSSASARSSSDDAAAWQSWMFGAACEIDRLQRSEAAHRRVMRDGRRRHMAWYDRRVRAIRGRTLSAGAAYWLAVAGVTAAVALAVAWR